ncbi:phage tail protein I [Gracilibacillus xinjiangensis]|uniref:Phage tail protein I n=1 Tax=Gracilibacillus xinjiangensis TaxID=1193282 RepID=A0ABV8WZ80_9BACI
MNRLIDNTSVLDILPENLRYDSDINAASKAIDSTFFETTQYVDFVVILPKIDKLPEEFIDHLAWQMHVDFYEMDLPLKQKRELVKSSVLWHMKKGTPAAVEEVASVIFTDARVLEWFQYGGNPYFFKVELNHHTILNDDLSRLRKMIDATKNKRSKLESVDIVTKESIVIQEDQYSFGVPYPITNRFKTATRDGKAILSTILLEDQPYNFKVSYPICGRFRAGEAK